MRPILILTFLVASLATCLVATAGECRGGSCRVVSSGERLDRVRVVECGAWQKTRTAIRWVVRR